MTDVISIADLLRKKDRSEPEQVRLRVSALQGMAAYERQHRNAGRARVLEQEIARMLTGAAATTDRERALHMLRPALLIFTCDDCRWATHCEHAFDTYNTDGDCLDMK